MNEYVKFSRRDFLMAGGVLGGGLIIGVCLPGCRKGEEQPVVPDEPFVPNAFIRIDPDDAVTIICHKSEMGQGIYTALPMLVAEELDADWSKVRVQQSKVDPAYDHTMYGPMMVTGGSTSVRSEWDRLRNAGAAARTMLIAAAAKRWQVGVDTCRASRGFVIHGDGKQRLSFGQLAGDAAKQALPKEVQLKASDRFDLLGKPLARLDIPAKTNGQAVFGLDVTIPGLLCAVLARPPVFGGKIKSFDDTAAMKVAGVRGVYPIDRGIAVVADGFWAATRGREALQVDWDPGPLAGLDSESQGAQYRELAVKPGAVAARRGDVSRALAGAARKIEAEYEVPYLAHAPMEPLNCVADVRPESCEIWVGTQMQTGDRDAAAAITGLPKEKVSLHTTFLGGGFGRRAVPNSHFVREAVAVSKAAGAPVKLYWTREDDIRGGWYRPRAYAALVGGLDEAGKPVAWQHRIVCQSIMKGTPFESHMIQDGVDETSVEGAADSPYDIPNFLVDYHMAPEGVPVLWWRSVGHSINGFVKEGFIDELAHAGGQDPYQFRRQLLPEHSRERGVLDLAAEQSRWNDPMPAGRGRGIAMHKSFGSYIAQVAEVSVNADGGIRVHKVTCAIDCGRIVNPDTIRAQMESGIVFGLSAALHSAITFRNGRVQQSNFDDYQVLRMDEMPEVEVVIADSQEPPGGVGEPGVPPIAPAVANAVFAVSGARLRQLPMTRERVKKALAAQA